MSAVRDASRARRRTRPQTSRTGLIAELLRRGYAENDVRAIAGGNVLRVMRGAEAAARRIQAEQPPSEATIEALDG